MFYREAQQNIQSFLMALRRKPHCPERIHHCSWGRVWAEAVNRSPPAVGVFKEIPPHSSAFPALPWQRDSQSLAGDTSAGMTGWGVSGSQGHMNCWGLESAAGKAVPITLFLHDLSVSNGWHSGQEKFLRQNPSKHPPGMWKGGTVWHPCKGELCPDSCLSEITSFPQFPVSVLQWLCFRQGL